MKLFIYILLASFHFLHPLHAQIDHTAAQRYFTDVQQLLRSDAGRLWGKSLEGPILLVHPNSRTVVANYPDREGKLMRRGNVYTGSLPADIPLANTAVEWAGITWAMILTPVSSEAYSRNALFIHELWHRIQNDIGFPATDPSNNHLNTKEGRIWLQLEMRALQRALNRSGDQRREAVRDALLFRAHRHSLFSRGRDEERQLENHEGLAEYTGIVLAIASEEDRRRYTIRKLRQAERLQSYTRSFAYHTSPAYGLLLDAVSSGWTRSFSHRDHLPELVRAGYGIQLPRSTTEEAQRRAQIYDGETIVTAETERDRGLQRKLAEYKNRFITNPRLVLPLEEKRISFDPRSVTPLDNYGRVYETLTASDIWGSLNATGGALMTSDWSAIFIDLPESPRGRTIKGNGYVLELREGWEIVPGDRGGDYTVRKIR